MKRIGTMVICLLFLASLLAGCGQKETAGAKAALRPMLLVDGILYLDTGKQIPPEEGPFVTEGAIRSSVDVTLKPTENGQSNFGHVDAGYSHYQDGLIVNLDDTWIFFEKQMLALNDVIELSKRGDSLSWGDFARYRSEAVGSGLCILRYPIDGEPGFYIVMGGPSMEEKPWYIRLVDAETPDHFIDMQTGDVETFLAK